MKQFLEIDDYDRITTKMRIFDEEQHHLNGKSAIIQFKAWSETSSPGDIFVVDAFLRFIRLKSVTYCNPGNS